MSNLFADHTDQEAPDDVADTKAPMDDFATVCRLMTAPKIEIDLEVAGLGRHAYQVDTKQGRRGNTLRFVKTRRNGRMVYIGTIFPGADAVFRTTRGSKLASDDDAVRLFGRFHAALVADDGRLEEAFNAGELAVHA